MKKIIATLAPSNTIAWKNTPGKFNQLFSKLTGYDIMLEESRNDLPVNNNNGISSLRVISSLLTGSIKKYLFLSRRESCNTQR